MDQFLTSPSITDTVCQLVHEAEIKMMANWFGNLYVGSPVLWLLEKQLYASQLNIHYVPQHIHYNNKKRRIFLSFRGEAERGDFMGYGYAASRVLNKTHTHARTHAPTHTHMHARARAHALHALTHTTTSLSLSLSHTHTHTYTNLKYQYMKEYIIFFF